MKVSSEEEVERRAGRWVRRGILGILLGALLCTVSCVDPWDQELPFLLGGIQVNEPDHEVWARSLRSAGMNTVSVTVYAHQGDWATDHLWFDDSDEAVLSEIRAAKAQGLRVVLVLRLALDHAFEANRFLWHGMIHPLEPRQLRSWFDQYGEFVLTWAKIAQRERVDLLGIGSELNELTSTLPLEALPSLHEYYLNETKQAEEHQRILLHASQLEPRHLSAAGADTFGSLEEFLTTRSATYRRWASSVVGVAEGEDSVAAINDRRRALEEYWRALIQRVRSVYHGRLTYAANFDQYQDVGFWDALDVMGINAYFPVREGLESTLLEHQLEEGWTQVLQEISSFRTEQGLDEKNVVFTELGYTARSGCTIEPWASLGFSVLGPRDGGETRLVVWQDQPEDGEERALAIRGLGRAAKAVAPEMVQGLLYWKLSTQPGHRAIEPFVVVLQETSPDPILTELRTL